jgi:HSP20 family protein
MNKVKQGQSQEQQRLTSERGEEGRQGSQGGAMQRRGSPQGLSRYEGGIMRSPFKMMRRMMEDMDRMFEDFGFGPMSRLMPSFDEIGMALPEPTAWLPELEMLERDGNLIVRADLPGLRQEDVRVDIEGDMLTIEGERKSEQETERGGVYHSERSYGSFRRRIRLPRGVDASTCDASFDNGVLEVKLRLPQQQQKRTIAVKSGAGRAQPEAAQAAGREPAPQSARTGEVGQDGGQAPPPRH